MMKNASIFYSTGWMEYIEKVDTLSIRCNVRGHLEIHLLQLQLQNIKHFYQSNWKLFRFAFESALFHLISIFHF